MKRRQFIKFLSSLPLLSLVGSNLNAISTFDAHTTSSEFTELPKFAIELEKRKSANLSIQTSQSSHPIKLEKNQSKNNEAKTYFTFEDNFITTPNKLPFLKDTKTEQQLLSLIQRKELNKSIFFVMTHHGLSDFSGEWLIQKNQNYITHIENLITLCKIYCGQHSQFNQGFRLFNHYVNDVNYPFLLPILTSQKLLTDLLAYPSNFSLAKKYYQGNNQPSNHQVNKITLAFQQYANAHLESIEGMKLKIEENGQLETENTIPLLVNEMIVLRSLLQDNLLFKLEENVNYL